ncbi:hypothetical protein sscle_05g045740 [Sclerotinia sclerotiorum 1980 UF-70]|uniref:Uncharacterized protein n=1 Tax=Sclerotinia sclerotiorum (strain ATCC 18683 / 1980 / Ss-1) TaxID=665079 RepID=A0A1D9Q4D3_SCLS1|nr:hypothetical protein sscle_05g045740 [Sclerotinia sclerotiorum 1980 UF-70]
MSKAIEAHATGADVKSSEKTKLRTKPSQVSQAGPTDESEETLPLICMVDDNIAKLSNCSFS